MTTDGRRGPASPSPALPKVVWILWLQGWDNAPPVARACRSTWEDLNPGWDVRAISNRTLLDLVDVPARFPGVAGRWVSAEHFSDLTRLALLERHGGIWVDATAYCTRPLDEWLAPYAAEGFFAFALDKPPRMTASWFLAAPPGNYLVARWADAAERYWSCRDAADRYHWVHELFTGCYESDPVFRRDWDGTRKLPADGPHHFTPYQRELLRPFEEEDRRWVSGEEAPVLKLTRKAGGATPPSGSVLEYLLAAAAARRGPRQATRR